MGTALKRHKLSIDVIVTLHVHHKIQQINTRYKILQKDIAMYLLQSIFFFFSLFLIIIPLILPHLFLLEDAIDRRLAAAKSRGNRCCQTSVTSEISRKSLLPDFCHQRKLEEIAAARQTDFFL